MSEVTVAVAPADGLGPRVGFYETEAQGAGDTWRAAAWMATVVASLTSGIDLGQYVPSFTVEGRIDGPSAGSLLALGILAGLQGHDLPGDATMTGALGPDGTVAAVAGVVHKLEAARRSGKRLLLIPRGQREDINRYTNQPIDVIAYGEALGIEVREVDDLAAAYEALSGHRLPGSEGAGQEPELPADVQAALAARTTEWLGAYADRVRACQRLRGELSGSVDINAELAEARATAQQAETLASAGATAAAHDHAVMAAVHAAVLEEALRTVGAVATDGMAAIRSRLRSVEAADDGREHLLTEISDLQLSTADALLAAADAYGIGAEADGLTLAAAQLLDALEDQSDDASEVDLLLKTAVIAALHRNVVGIARDRLLLTVPRGPTARDTNLTWDRLPAWAETLERAAEANLSYFEAVCLDESARDLGLHPDVLRESMACQDLTYLMARSSLAALPSLRDGLAEARRADVATLGASMGAYAAASALIARFYSLRVQMDEQGNTVGVRDEAALDRMLDLAAGKARAAIASARSSGIEPVPPTYYYLVGRTYAEEDTLEKLEALQCFWYASLSARVAVLLSGKR